MERNILYDYILKLNIRITHLISFLTFISVLIQLKILSIVTDFQTENLGISAFFSAFENLNKAKIANYAYKIRITSKHSIYQTKGTKFCLV